MAYQPKKGESMKANGRFDSEDRGKWVIVYHAKLVTSGNQPLYDTQEAAEEDARRISCLPDAYIMEI